MIIHQVAAVVHQVAILQTVVPQVVIHPQAQEVQLRGILAQQYKKQATLTNTLAVIKKFLGQVEKIFISGQVYRADFQSQQLIADS